jgi:hypothetical protein
VKKKERKIEKKKKLIKRKKEGGRRGERREKWNEKAGKRFVFPQTSTALYKRRCT